ncbi:hypothetical protein [Acidithiobacillus ferrivorans]|uniref:hypothetical protein n=1 Tax=Acidithiobacillus ferrivorans TaxID=160808 RepID=UPI0009F49959|nr:hypothetical protein [Acidithiobacillus ferrivorans]
MVLLLLLPWMLAPVDAAPAPCALSMTGVAAHGTQIPRCEQALGAPAQQGTCLTACCHHDMMTPVAESARNITPAISALAVSVASWITLPSSKPKPVPHFLRVVVHTGLPPLSAVRFLI